MTNKERLIQNRNLVLAECKALLKQIIARDVFVPYGTTESQMRELIRKIDVLIYGCTVH